MKLNTLNNNQHSENIHIASFIVYCQPAQTALLCTALIQFAGVEIVDYDHRGHIVITWESDAGLAIDDLLSQLNLLHGVVNVTLISHFMAPLEDLQQEHRE